MRRVTHDWPGWTPHSYTAEVALDGRAVHDAYPARTCGLIACQRIRDTTTGETYELAPWAVQAETDDEPRLGYLLVWVRCADGQPTEQLDGAALRDRWAHRHDPPPSLADPGDAEPVLEALDDTAETETLGTMETDEHASDRGGSAPIDPDGTEGGEPPGAAGPAVTRMTSKKGRR